MRLNCSESLKRRCFEHPSLALDSRLAQAVENLAQMHLLHGKRSKKLSRELDFETLTPLSVYLTRLHAAVSSRIAQGRYVT